MMDLGKIAESWLRQGPPLEELVAEIKDQRKPWKRETAVVIPTYKRKEILTRHVERLATQTLDGFDIIIVYDQKDEFIVPPPRTSVVHIRGRGANGCAGAFYTGQGFALAERYQRIILADDDALPESDRLLESIVDLLEDYDVVLPKTRLLPLKATTDVIHMYGGMRTKVLEKVGLTFLPLHIGGEDLELMDRIRRDGSISVCTGDGPASHPFQPSIFFFDLRRLDYYSRGTMLRSLLGGAHANTVKTIFFQILLGTMFFINGKPDVSLRCLRIAWDVSDARFFQDENIEAAPPGMIAKKEATAPRIDIAFVDAGTEQEISAGAIKKRPDLSALPAYSLKKIWRSLGGLLDIKDYFGRNILFVDRWEPLDLPVVLMARRSLIRFKGETYEIAKERTTPALMMGLVLVAGVVPLAVLVSVVLTLRGIVNMKIKRISSQGYGVRTSTRSRLFAF